MKLFTRRFVVAVACLVTVASVLCAQDVMTSAPAPTTAPTTSPSTGTETIVFFRHGEKPKGGLGQINAQGFNRAIALATLLPTKYGKPDLLIAPDPAQTVTDAGQKYNYVRPLATIEPIAVALAMPVYTPCGYQQVDKLNAELTKPERASALIFVAWEHLAEAAAARKLITQFGGDASPVPDWPGEDFDSLYVVRITRSVDQPPRVTFTHDHEGLDHLSKQMPTAAGSSAGATQ
jgi:hypothetical protein